MADHRPNFILLILIILLAAGLCRAREATDVEPLVAAQVHVLGGTTWPEVGAELDRLRDAGFNAVILRVFQNGRDRYHAITGMNREEDTATGVYFTTAFAPTLTDLLTPLGRMCRERGLRLFAWMSTRRMDWLDMAEAHDRSWNPEAGRILPAEEYDLFNPSFRRYLLEIFTDLARQPVDGIILQDDFVIRTLYGFSPAGLERFHMATGLALDPTHLFVEHSAGNVTKGISSKLYEQWAVFKAEYLLELAEDLAARCRATRPGIVMGMNVYYDTALSARDGLNWLGQNLPGMTACSYDLMLLMAYHRQAAEELGLDVTKAIEALGRTQAELYGLFGPRLVVKLQARDWSTAEDIDDGEWRSLVAVLPTGLRHIAVAPVESGAAIYRQMRMTPPVAAGDND